MKNPLLEQYLHLLEPTEPKLYIARVENLIDLFTSELSGLYLNLDPGDVQAAVESLILNSLSLSELKCQIQSELSPGTRHLKYNLTLLVKDVK